MKTKRKNVFRGLIFMFNLFWKYQKSALVCLALSCIIGGALPMAGVVFPKFILDALFTSRDTNTLIIAVSLLLGCSLFGNTLVSFLEKKYQERRKKCSSTWFAALSYDVYESDIAYTESARFLDAKHRAIKFLNPPDGSGFGGVLRKTFSLISKGITLGGIIAVISLLNPLVVLLFTGLVLLNALFSSKIKKINIKIDLESSDMDKHIGYNERLFFGKEYAKEIRMNRLGDWLLEMKRRIDKEVLMWMSMVTRNDLKLTVFSNVMFFIQQGVSYGYLIYTALNGSITIGEFTMYLAAIGSFSGAMNGIMEDLVDIVRFGEYYDAVEGYTNIPKHQRENKGVTIEKNRLPEFEFQGVSFRYPGQNHYSLRNITVKIPAGEKVAMVGENGAGKTTFTKLLLRLYRPDEGRILLNGRDIYDYDFDEYVKQFSVVFQDFALYSMPLRDNVAAAAGKQEANDEAIRAALEQSGFGDKLKSLEKGLDTYIYKDMHDEGFEPSGGEGQKIAMARALLKDGTAIILDEPTAALDPRAEYELYMRFNSMVQGKTAFFVTHRQASVKFCDRVLVFKNGELVENGNHDALMAAGGLYHELFTMQAQFYEQEDNQ